MNQTTATRFQQESESPRTVVHDGDGQHEIELFLSSDGVHGQVIWSKENEETGPEFHYIPFAKRSTDGGIFIEFTGDDTDRGVFNRIPADGLLWLAEQGLPPLMPITEDDEIGPIAEAPAWETMTLGEAKQRQAELAQAIRRLIREFETATSARVDSIYVSTYTEPDAENRVTVKVVFEA